jgi:hypothetical protein
LITALFIIPAYILYLIAIIKMSIWWCQNKSFKERKSAQTTVDENVWKWIYTHNNF